MPVRTLGVLPVKDLVSVASLEEDEIGMSILNTQTQKNYKCSRQILRSIQSCKMPVDATVLSHKLERCFICRIPDMDACSRIMFLSEPPNKCASPKARISSNNI